MGGFVTAEGRVLSWFPEAPTHSGEAVFQRGFGESGGPCVWAATAMLVGLRFRGRFAPGCGA
eukprot:10733455-Lingulodinium_polyedra.AAC.1